MTNVAKINPDNCVHFTPQEALEMALDDVKSCAINPKKIYIITEGDYYAAGISNNYEAIGMLFSEMEYISRKKPD